ncbi:hypothetical protein [Saccharopolyspora taberi]|uniref:Uncharacterized protein n=1 Tax=Saccharopolyspora taberi TaxID=60895 RepID=A0ABN3VAL4_9PSEU
MNLMKLSPRDAAEDLDVQRLTEDCVFEKDVVPNACPTCDYTVTTIICEPTHG